MLDRGMLSVFRRSPRLSKRASLLCRPLHHLSGSQHCRHRGTRTSVVHSLQACVSVSHVQRKFKWLVRLDLHAFSRVMLHRLQASPLERHGLRHRLLLRLRTNIQTHTLAHTHTHKQNAQTNAHTHARTHARSHVNCSRILMSTRQHMPHPRFSQDRGTNKLHIQCLTKTLVAQHHGIRWSCRHVRAGLRAFTLRGGFVLRLVLCL